jgi:hypothetical protein
MNIERQCRRKPDSGLTAQGWFTPDERRIAKNVPPTLPWGRVAYAGA